jgi:hypothetical protein
MRKIPITARHSNADPHPGVSHFATFIRPRDAVRVGADYHALSCS